MKRIIILIMAVLLTALLSNTAFSQSFSGIQWDWYDIAARTAIATGNKNIAPDSCAALQIGRDTTKYGLLLPRVVDTAITGQKNGLMIYRLTDNNIYFHNGTKWMALGGCCEGSGGMDYDTLVYYATFDQLAYVVDFLQEHKVWTYDSSTAGWQTGTKYATKYFSEKRYVVKVELDNVDLAFAGTYPILSTDAAQRFAVSRFDIIIKQASGVGGTPVYNLGWTPASYNDLLSGQTINSAMYHIAGRILPNAMTFVPQNTVPPNSNLVFNITTPGTGTWTAKLVVEGYYYTP